MKESGLVISVMVMVFRSGLMERNMKVIGKRMQLMGMALFIMWMEIYFRGNGEMIKLTAMVYIHILMEQSMKENGKMIFNMEKELKYGVIILDILVNM